MQAPLSGAAAPEIADVRAGTDLPLAVDLDGTLVQTDLFLESVCALIRGNPFYLFAAALWMLKGRALLKRRIAERVTIDVSALPYHQGVLDYVKAERTKRKIILATAEDQAVAHQVAGHLQIFDEVLGSGPAVNLSGSFKRDRLVSEFGQKRFDYAGDSRRDLAVWSSARKAILINPPRGLLDRVSRIAEVGKVFREGEDRKHRLRHLGEAMRLYQWLKNLLLFVPMVMAHRFFEGPLIVRSVTAFLAFGLSASSVYLLNDLVDMPADRRHPRKRHRPFASGQLSPAWGLMGIPLLLTLSLALSLLLPLPFLGIILIYFVLNFIYSVWLKQIALLDVIVLTGLYTLRVMAGSASVAIWPSAWLLAFCTFLFLSLALVKRYAELLTIGGTGRISVRGYEIADKDLLASLGAGSGYVAVLVLVIYISSGIAEIHYTRQQLIWLLCPLLLYWISYVWLVAHRGGMHDDPLVFTLKDPISRIVMSLAAVVWILAL